MWRLTEPSLNNSTDTDSVEFGEYVYPITVYGARVKDSAGSRLCRRPRQQVGLLHGHIRARRRGIRRLRHHRSGPESTGGVRNFADRRPSHIRRAPFCRRFLMTLKIGRKKTR